MVIVVGLMVVVGFAELADKGRWGEGGREDIPAMGGNKTARHPKKISVEQHIFAVALLYLFFPRFLLGYY